MRERVKARRGREEENIVAVCESTVGSKSREDRRTVREKSVGKVEQWAKGMGWGRRVKV